MEPQLADMDINFAPQANFLLKDFSSDEAVLSLRTIVLSYLFSNTQINIEQQIVQHKSVDANNASNDCVAQPGFSQILAVMRS